MARAGCFRDDGCAEDGADEDEEDVLPFCTAPAAVAVPDIDEEVEEEDLRGRLPR